VLYGQQVEFDLNQIKFHGLDFSLNKDLIIETFGNGKKVDTNYECGFFTNDQEGGPYYQLVYPDFNYIGSDKEKFYLANVNFDQVGRIKINYGEKDLNGQTTKEDFIIMFGEKAKKNFEKYMDTETLLLYSKEGDDGAIFRFKNGRLIKFEYWTPC
jgi:hypothetical protein